MKIVAGKIYALRIPFVEEFSHATKNRRFSDSFVVKLIADDGATGYGEGAARPYVTGETVAGSVAHIRQKLYPAVAAFAWTDETAAQTLETISQILPAPNQNDRIIFNAARAASEVAALDCRLKSKKASLAEILPPRRDAVVYSGVVTAGETAKAVQIARRFALFGVKQLKIKINSAADAPRVAAIRQGVGADTSLRVDANGAFDVRTAIEFAEQIAESKIESFEQPIPRGAAADLATVKKNSPIPVMADESLVTIADAEQLAAAGACDFFNLRVSKLGGIAPTLAIARIAERAGIKLQIGCQVGETAVLSAAGRWVAAHLADVSFVEGSFGNLLLAEDTGREHVNFGHGGRAKLLRGHGLGVEVRDEILEKYAVEIVNLGEK